MDVFQEYKPLRNKVAQLCIEDALGVIWAYCNYLQMDDFQFPRQQIEVRPEFLNLELPRGWVPEWELELLAKEVVINAGTAAWRGRTLRTWNTLAEIVNSLKSLEDRIYGAFGSPESVLVEMIRMAHRQFIWQGNRPSASLIVRYFKIFSRPAIDEICQARIGLDIWQTYMCGVACIGHFLHRPTLTVPFTSNIDALPIELFEKFFAFMSKPIYELRAVLKSEQQYNANFAYAYNSLRAYPLVKMLCQGNWALVCPLMTLLCWRFTGGLYYELINVPEFANEFGAGFQRYVGDVIERACPNPMRRLDEREYWRGKSKKRSVDWIVADECAALFIECKAKRLSWGAKVSLTDLGALEADIDTMAAAVVQVYKTLADYLANSYPHFPFKEGRKIFPTVVTLEHWRMFGPVMMAKLDEAVASRISAARLPADLCERMPYSVWAIEDLEAGLQLMHANGIADFMEGKLSSKEMSEWDWTGYMSKRYPKSGAVRELFSKEYEEMFSKVLRMQRQAC
jgi:hypothetical protein